MVRSPAGECQELVRVGHSARLIVRRSREAPLPRGSWSNEEATKEEPDVRFGEFRLLDFALGVIPLVKPVDHAEGCERRQTRLDERLPLRLLLDFSNGLFQEMNVVPLVRVDFLA